MPFYVVHVPYYGFVIVWITSIIFFVTSSLLFKKYSEKKAMPTKYLGLSLFSFGIGSFLMGLLLFIDNFGLRIKPGYPNAYIGFVFDFIFISLGNVFFVVFIVYVYADNNNQVLITMSALTAINIGLFLPELKFDQMFPPEMTYYLIYYNIVSFLLYGFYIYKTHKELKNAVNKIAKRGLLLMEWYGIFVLISYVFGMLDSYVGVKDGILLSMFFYIGYFVLAFASILAYLGFVLPSWLRK